MKILKNIVEAESVIQSAIGRYGHLAQHHFQLFANYSRKGEAPLFFDFGLKRGIMAYRKARIWRILTDPIAPSADKVKILIKLINRVFKEQKGQKIIIEDLTENLRKELQTLAKGRPWRVIKPSYSLWWPLIDLKNFNEDLSGRAWKRLRNIRNKFFKENQIEFVLPKEVEREELKKIVFQWKEQRKDTDRVHLHPYIRFIEKEFRGCDLVRIMKVNGQVAAINAGWSVPNSQNYYSNIGLYDYNCRSIGEVSYLDEIIEAKKAGYQKFDLGGSCDGLLPFKMKFHPAEIYRTDTFSVLKK